MTSEVVVMNRLGVALASDSAATVGGPGRTKLYHADKLFMLSAFHPVGMMIYNNSSLLDVPWETIIKLYRRELGRSSFDTLTEYGSDFISFLNASSNLFPESLQKAGLLQSLTSVFCGIADDIKKETINIALQSAGNIDTALSQARESVIERVFQEWSEVDDLVFSDFPADMGTKLIALHSGAVNRLVTSIFERDGINHAQQTKLFQLARMVVQKARLLPTLLSGVVIAGFGDKEHFPSLASLEIGGVFDGRLKYLQGRGGRVNGEEPAIIEAFGQAESIDAFLHGVSPAFYNTLTKEIMKVLIGGSRVIVDGYPSGSKKTKSQYAKLAEATARDLAIEFSHEIRELYDKAHYKPILGSIAHLPKAELASVAATFVNLSSFQKRVHSNEDETVGGPVDVAVITKGDGFVWIQRKHYFRPELNTHLFDARYTPKQETGEKS